MPVEFVDISEVGISQNQNSTRAGPYGLERIAPKFSFAKVMERVRGMIAAIAPDDSVGRRHAKLIVPSRVEGPLANGERQRQITRTMIIATGPAPVVPQPPGCADAGCRFWAKVNTYAAGEGRGAHVNPRVPALVKRFHDWRLG